MKKAICLSLFILFSSNVFSQWILDATLPIDSLNNPVIQEVCVIDSSVSWIFGVTNITDLYPHFYKRVNAEWRKINHDLSASIDGSCFYATDSLNVWLGTSWPEEIYYSSNGGVNWIIQCHISDTAYVEAIMFDKQNPKTGYAFADIGHNGMWSGVRIIKTTNSGQNWTIWDFENYGFRCADRSMCIVDSNHAWFGVQSVQGGGAKMISTSNGGINWIIKDVNAGAYGPFSVQFSSDKQTGLYFAQTNPTSWIYRTTNAGINWNIFYTTTFYYSKSVRWVRGTSNIYGSSEFVLIRSVDNGINWRQMTGGPGTNLESLDAVRINQGTIYALAVTYDRRVYKLLDTARVIGIENTSTSIPKEFRLYQNYPNPFNPKTTINFDIPKNSNIDIKVYDIMGKLVAVLSDNEFKNAGSYKVTWEASNFASGIYFYRIEADNFVDSKKMVLVK